MDSNKFSFPFQPYAIQEKFMKELYNTLQNKKLGIFESPTGTGKSLSICCSALQWLKDYNQHLLEELKKEIALIEHDISCKADSDDWLQEEYEKIKLNQKLNTSKQKFNQIKTRNENFNMMKVRVVKSKENSTNKIKEPSLINQLKSNENKENNSNMEDEDLMIEEYEDTADDHSDSDDNSLALDNNDDYVKIYISSRTHSQLSQFIGEVKQTIFKEDTRVVTLASRQHYCINADVTKLKNINLINERCLEMQKSKSKSTSVDEDGNTLKKVKKSSCTACPYYNQGNIIRLKERMLVDIMDMEDLVKCGKSLKACPYYASRKALDDAELVLICHAGIVSKGSRSGISLKLDNNILILDEAHGLIAALESAYSAPISVKQLISVKTILQFYINKYRARLSSKNLLCLNQISFVVAKLLGMIQLKNQNQKVKESKPETMIYTLEDFVIKAEIDHLNLKPLVEFCRNTRLAPKLHGFSMRYNQEVLEAEIKKNNEKKNSSLEMFLKNISKTKEKPKEVKTEENKDVQLQTEVSAGNGLYAVLDFMEMLCERSEDGRVLTQYGENSGQLKYLLLNPTRQFADVVERCRSVIVAGGTMEPINEFQALLGGNADNINIVKCDHVVPLENVLALSLSKGPSLTNLNFSFENRMSKNLLQELGNILRNVCSIVPGGIVCFLPSYSYENHVYEHLKNNKVIEAINKKKNVFREPKSANEVDQVLQKFAAAVRGKDTDGALLLSVVGGKLSEGLNFSDDLGRCVMVVGMPYPNIKSPELQEKMNYLNKIQGNGAGNLYYENLCMKSVNQCIGRAVRHANDYATVLLVDDRYSRSQTIAALPSFVRKSLVSNCTFGQAVGNMAKFFARHKRKK